MNLKDILIILLIACAVVGGVIYVKNCTEQQTQDYQACLQENSASYCKAMFYY